MKGDFHYLKGETRTETIFRHTLVYTKRTSMQTFALDVVRAYLNLVPNENSREVKFHIGGDHYKDLEANAQKLSRYIDPSINARLPADLEEAWVFGLGEPERGRCFRDLAARYGLLAVPIPAQNPLHKYENIATLFKEVGEAATFIAPILEAGLNDHISRDRVIKAHGEILDVVNSAMTLLARIDEYWADDNG